MDLEKNKDYMDFDKDNDAVMDVVMDVVREGVYLKIEMWNSWQGIWMEDVWVSVCVTPLVAHPFPSEERRLFKIGLTYY
jgi:hypothetical protein